MEGASRLKDILKVIAEHRVARGWTEYQLAEHAGLPQSTILFLVSKKDDSYGPLP